MQAAQLPAAPRRRTGAILATYPTRIAPKLVDIPAAEQSLYKPVSIGNNSPFSEECVNSSGAEWSNVHPRVS